MARDIKIAEQYLDYAPPVVVYGSLEMLLRHVPEEHLDRLHNITLTNSAALLKTRRGKISSEKRRVRPADCPGLYGRGSILFMVDPIFMPFPFILFLFPPV